MKPILLSLFLLFFGFITCQEDYSSLENLENDDYEVLNIFFSEFNQYHYIDTIIPLEKFNFRINDLYVANLNLFKSADNICKTETNLEKLKFYCPLADTFKKYENLFEENDFNYLNEHYKEKGVEANIKLSKITNPQLINHSEDYYMRLTSENKSISATPANRFTYSTLKILGIYYTEDKQTAIIVFQNNMPDTSGGLNYHILKKQNNIWWKSLGLLQKV